MDQTAWAEINLSALAHNLQSVRRIAPQSRVVAMIKADAYGHGLIRVAEALSSRADKLGVARFEEARTLREHGISPPLLLMGSLLTAEQVRYCSANNIAIALHASSQLDLIESASPGPPLELWLKLDTGMNRLGLDAKGFSEALERLRSSPHHLKLMTHFSSADCPDEATTRLQIERFMRLAEQAPGCERSLANSAGIIAWPESHADWLRPGIMLYGDNPVAGFSVDLEPVMTLKSRVIAVKSVQPGDSVGYNGLWRATTPSRIAAIGIGYGDGYPRQLGNGTPVLINGQRFPVVGRISMDICSVDIGQATVEPGDEVTLWGNDLPAAEIAARAGTISYHLFTGVTQRVPRLYS